MNVCLFPRTQPPRFFSRTGGFTLIELLITVAIIGVLAALLTPVVGSMQRKAAATQCIANLRQVHAFLMEDISLTDEMPAAWNGSTGWVDTKRDALRLEKNSGYKAFGCPLQRKTQHLASDARTYSMNSHLVNDYWNPPPGKVPKYRDPSKVAVLTDGAVRNGSYNAAVSVTYPCERIHDGRANIAFLDGHVEAVKDIPNNQNPPAGSPESIFWLGR